MAVPNPHPSHAFRHAVSAPAARLSLRHQRVRWLRHGLGAVLALAVVASGGAAQAAPFAYLTVSGNTVPVFDLETNTVVANVALTTPPGAGAWPSTGRAPVSTSRLPWSAASWCRCCT